MGFIPVLAVKSLAWQVSDHDLSNCLKYEPSRAEVIVTIASKVGHPVA